jgi:hypothetical protein
MGKGVPQWVKAKTIIFLAHPQICWQTERIFIIFLWTTEKKLGYNHENRQGGMKKSFFGV